MVEINANPTVCCLKVDRRTRAFRLFAKLSLLLINALRGANYLFSFQLRRIKKRERERDSLSSAHTHRDTPARCSNQSEIVRIDGAPMSDNRGSTDSVSALQPRDAFEFSSRLMRLRPRSGPIISNEGMRREARVAFAR